MQWYMYLMNIEKEKFKNHYKIELVELLTVLFI